MKNREIGLIAVLTMLQFPLVGVIEVLFIYLFLERICKNIKDHLLTMTIPIV